MDLKSLILNPAKETILKIHLDGQDLGYFVLGKKKMSYLGDNLSQEKLNNIVKNNFPLSENCIHVAIYNDDKDHNLLVAYLDDFFLSPPGKSKTDCTQLDSSIFFKLFDVVIPEIDIKKFVLLDISYKALNNCKWKLGEIGFFLQGRSYYEKYGFTNEEHSTPAAKREIADLRATAILNDLYLNNQDKLKKIGDNLIPSDDSYKDNLNEMPLEYFILKYLKPKCEEKNYKGPIGLLDSILLDIRKFLEEDGFNNNLYIKYYPVIEDRLKPEIVIIEPEDEDEIMNMYINTRSKGGGRRKHKIYKNKIYKKKTKKNYKSYKNYKKKTNRRRTIKKYKR